MVSVAFTGGGTGGHIYPGLAVASCIKNNYPCRIFWIGSSKGMDKAIVEEAGLEFFGIPSGKLRRYFSLRNISDTVRVIAGFFIARKILKKEKPVILFSKGGFVSVPPAAAAASLKIPVFTHESDLTPGLATRINLRFAEKHFIPYEESKTFYSAKYRNKLHLSGNPVREVFRFADASKGRNFLGIKENEPILLVLGGSSGSLEINNLIRECLTELTRYYTVVHQTGSNEKQEAVSSGRYLAFPYFHDELPHVLAASEIVVCRGGAGTIWECAAMGKPMVIIPLHGTGTRGDQVENAELFEKAGAAVSFLCGGTNLKANAEKLAGIISSLSGDKAKIKKMAESNPGKMGAEETIAKTIIQRMGIT